MKTTTHKWFFRHLLCFLVGTLVDSSSLPPSTLPRPVNTKVGEQVVLPCSWKSRLGEMEMELPACHIQWKNPANTVFEQLGQRKFEAPGFEGRVGVLEERLGSGDCSLIIRDVQIMDMGRYESFMVVDGAWSTKTRVFIQSVKLLVSDHKSLQTRAPGEDLVLDLHTSHSVRVIFQGRNSSDWTDLWMKDDENSQGLEKHPLREQLTIKSLKLSDEGLYKVLDEHGLAVSTVKLSVEGETPTLPPEGANSHKLPQTQDNQQPTDGASTHSFSALLLLSVLVTSFQSLHLS
ncbi:galectin 17 isoform X1 [Labrus mixtus]|uniref:galectin 17 isoform X1 n=1 Tax=Labrus mixtus TaxID=508554 RepID=UPI0029C024DC|nr:galectin 17 isoform X1 [Labrus mixtus]